MASRSSTALAGGSRRPRRESSWQATRAWVGAQGGAMWRNLPPQTEMIDHGGTLPDLGRTGIVLYRLAPDDPVSTAMGQMLRQTYGAARPVPGRIAAE